jgi:hypothetical protein
MQIERIAPAFGYWLAGFVDGEGCFFIRRNVVPYKGREYVTYGCSLSIAVRLDDLPVLEMIQRTLGMGKISSRNQKMSPLQKPAGALSISRKEDVVSLVDLFDAFPLQSKKARDFEVWKRAVHHWDSHHRRGRQPAGRMPDWSAMAAFHQELKDVRKYREATA